MGASKAVGEVHSAGAQLREERYEGGRLVLVQEPRPEAHGEILWSLPPVGASLDGSAEAGVVVLPKRGDASSGELGIAAGGGQVGEAFEVQRDAWAQAELPVGPEVAHVFRASLGAKVTLGWEVTRGTRVLPVRTPTLLPATHTNTFLIGEGEALLIEPASGDADECEAMCRWVEQCGVKVVAIALTHHHRDHIGGAAHLSEALNAPLFAHRDTVDRCPEVRFARELRDGERLEIGGKTLEILHTPGHAPGHLCFLDVDTGLLVAGDMVAGVETILIEPGDGDMNRYWAQLERLARSGARWLIPSHGGLVLDGPGLLRKTASHRRMRDDKVGAALRGVGPAEVDALLPVVYDDVPKALYPFARLSLLAHLEAMAHRGEAAVLGGIWRTA